MLYDFIIGPASLIDINLQRRPSVLADEDNAFLLTPDSPIRVEPVILLEFSGNHLLL